MYTIPTKKQTLCSCCRVYPRISRFYEYCKNCSTLKEKRALQWYTWKEKEKHTIWTGELQDKQSQIALVSLKFDLKNWLNGKEIQSLNSMCLEKNDEETLANRLSELHEEIKKVLENSGDSDSFWFEVLQKLQFDSKEKIDNWIPDKSMGIKAKSKKIKLEVAKQLYQRENKELLSLVLKKMFKEKSPSLARIRRIWNATSIFFEETKTDIKDSIHKKIKTRTLRGKRIYFYATTKSDIKNFNHHNIENIPVEFILKKTENKNEVEFISTSNIEQAFPDKGWEEIKGNILKRIKDGFKVNIENESVIFHYQNESITLEDDYIPFVEIMNTPELFQFLCPANEAETIVKNIYSKYKIEMSKVRDRLPLHVNVLYFKNKYPLYVVLETAKNMISDEYLKPKKEKWSVKETKKEQKISYPEQKVAEDIIQKARESQSIKLKLVNNNNAYLEYTWNIDCMTADPSIEDLYYPNFEITKKEDRGEDTDYTEFTRIWKETVEGKEFQEKRNYLNVKELREGDVVNIQPSTFDFAFVDNTKARFTVDGKTRSHPVMTEGREVYYLDDLDTFERIWKIFEKANYSQTQLKSLQYILISKRQEWFEKWTKNGDDEVIKYFIRSVIMHPNQLGKYFKGEETEEYKLLEQACKNGMIFDIIDYYCNLCGKKLGSENKGEKNDRREKILYKNR